MIFLPTKRLESILSKLMVAMAAAFPWHCQRQETTSGSVLSCPGCLHVPQPRPEGCQTENQETKMVNVVGFQHQWLKTNQSVQEAIVAHIAWAGSSHIFNKENGYIFLIWHIYSTISKILAYLFKISYYERVSFFSLTQHQQQIQCT